MEVGEIWFKDFYNSAGGIKKRKEKKKRPTKPHFVIASREYFGHKIALAASV